VEARRQAVLKFGAVDAIKEDYRDQGACRLWEFAPASPSSLLWTRR
jgi:hypothetical protein